MTDAHDLAPAQRKRGARRPAADEPATSVEAADGGELLDRFGALESIMRSVDIRVEALERLTRTGQLVERVLEVERLVSEQSAALGRIEGELRALGVRLQTVDERGDVARDAGDARAADLALSVARVQATVDALDLSDLRSEMRLVADRLSSLLGGPTLTELMDRVDAIATPVEPAPAKRRRRT